MDRKLSHRKEDESSGRSVFGLGGCTEWCAAGVNSRAFVVSALCE
jgi:hypothetical protein